MVAAAVRSEPGGKGMTPNRQSSASTATTTHSRRSFVRLLLGISLGSSALAVSACTPGRPVRSPRFHGGQGNDKDRSGRS
jgi:hypothetical protein